MIQNQARTCKLKFMIRAGFLPYGRRENPSPAARSWTLLPAPQGYKSRFLTEANVHGKDHQMDKGKEYKSQVQKKVAVRIQKERVCMASATDQETSHKLHPGPRFGIHRGLIRAAVRLEADLLGIPDDKNDMTNKTKKRPHPGSRRPGASRKKKSGPP